MRGTFFKGALVGGIGAAAVLAASAAIAGSGIGDTFNLGQTNTVDETSVLTGAKAGKMLQITNTSTGAGATALGLTVPAGKAPMTVSSAVKVVGLNADKLDGLTSSSFLRTTGKAADSGLLDGLDSTAFGRAQGVAVTVDPGVNGSVGLLGGFLGPVYDCSDPTTGNGALLIRNQSGSIANVFVDSGGANPVYTQMSSNQEIVYPAAATGDSFHIQAQGTPGVLVVDVASVHSDNGCYTQALSSLAVN